MLLIAFAAGWVGGLLLGAAGLPWSALLGPGALALVLAAGLHRRFGAPLAVWLLLALVAVLLARWRYPAYQSAVQNTAVARFTDRSIVRVRGVVADEPSPYGVGTEFPVDVAQLENGGGWLPADGAVMTRNAGDTPFRVGDRVEVDGVLLPPDPQLPFEESPLQQAGIEAVANRPVLVAAGAPAGGIAVTVARWREAASAALTRALPEPEAGLARGITLGERRTLDPALTADFSQTNTSHLLAIDGYKVGLVIGVLESLLGLARAPALSAGGTIAGVGLYVLFVGATPSALRAGIMGGLFALGRALGRPNDTLNAIALAALVMTAINPLLLWNLAFQLSFTTTLGMAALAPIAEGWLPRWPGPLREAVGTTLAAEIASAPLVIVAFDHLSLASLPVHAVVMPLLPAAIGLSALTAGVGTISPAAASLVGLLAWAPLAAIVAVVRWAGELPEAALALPPLGLGAVLIGYGALGLAVLSRPNPFFGPGLPLAGFWRRATAVVPARWLVAGLALPAIVLAAVLLRPGTPTDEVRVLNVGGDAALVRLAGGGTVYLQGDATAVQVARGIDPQLPVWDRSLDLVVLTAGDDQALTDLGDLAGRLTLRRVILPAAGYSAVASQRWQAMASQQQIGTVPARPGLQVALGTGRSLATYLLDPVPKQGRAAARPASLAVRLVLGPATVLWASALPADQVRLRATGEPLGAQVLKLVGSGATWGLDPQFLAAVNPQVVILPSGAASRFAKATPGTLDLLAGRQVYRTDVDGTVVIDVGASGLTIRTQP